MKKTYSINLNNQIFCIDEDAYQQLHTYIGTLEKYYLNEEGGKEIMADIENRIAELFRQFLQASHQEVITITEINRVIEIMGSPDVIIDEDTEYTSPRPESSSLPRKLYRNPADSILGGVASGLAAYFSLPVLWIRLFFILVAFLYGTAILIYIILWIVLPEATTAKQKLEMQGKNINVSNIEKNIRKTYEDVKKNSRVREIRNKIADCLTETGGIIRNLVSALGRVFCGITLLAGIFFFLAACWGIFFSFHLFPESYSLFFQYLCAPIPIQLIKLLLFCLINIPLLLVVYYSASCLFRFQSRKTVLFVGSTIWIFCCFCGIFLGVYYKANNAESYRGKTEIPWVADTSGNNIIYVKFNKSSHNESIERYDGFLDRYLLYQPDQSQDSTTLYMRPSFIFRKTNQEKPQLVISKTARGFSGMEAAANRENICYNYQWQGDTLCLDNYFTLYSPKIRANEICVYIDIPENYQINLFNPVRIEQHGLSIFKQPRDFLEGSPVFQTYCMKNNHLIKVSK